MELHVHNATVNSVLRRRAQYWRTKRGFAFFLFTGTEF